jgi:hypothetical protein
MFSDPATQLRSAAERAIYYIKIDSFIRPYGIYKNIADELLKIARLSFDDGEGDFHFEWWREEGR